MFKIYDPSGRASMRQLTFGGKTAILSGRPTGSVCRFSRIAKKTSPFSAARDGAAPLSA